MGYSFFALNVEERVLIKVSSQELSAFIPKYNCAVRRYSNDYIVNSVRSGKSMHAAFIPTEERLKVSFHLLCSIAHFFGFFLLFKKGIPK